MPSKALKLENHQTMTVGNLISATHDTFSIVGYSAAFTLCTHCLTAVAVETEMNGQRYPVKGLVNALRDVDQQPESERQRHA